MDKQLARNLQSRILEVNALITAAGVVFLAKDTGRCLLQLRNSDKRYKHTWGFFGGLIDKGETPFEALQRELVEEIGFMPELHKLNPIDAYSMQKLTHPRPMTASA